MNLFEKFFKEARDLFFIIDSRGFLVEGSPSWESHLGWTLEELKSKSLNTFLHEEDRGLLNFESINHKIDLDSPYINCRFLHKNGSYRWLSWRLNKIENEPMLFAMARDITDLRKNNLTLEALMASLDDLILLVDDAGVFVDLWTSNPDMLFLPKEKLLGRNIRDVFGYFGVGLESVLLQSFRLDRSLSMEFQFPNNPAWFSAKVNPIKKTSGQKRLASFLVRDITHKIDADNALDNERAKLLAASKMATLGEMAAGIAHEINNPLSIIQGKAWLLKKHMDENKVDLTKFAVDLQAIHDTTLRISKIIHGLKKFARTADKDPFVETSISSLIDDSLALCYEKFKNSGIQIRVLGEQPYKFECRSIQISQVFLNLLSNSFDAIEGTLDPWIEVQIKELSDEFEISFTDSGKGISQFIQEKIMQPFFTTKEVGKGTGLGLSISQGIIQSHNGDLYYDKGSTNTRFVIRMPKKLNSSQSQPA